MYKYNTVMGIRNDFFLHTILVFYFPIDVDYNCYVNLIRTRVVVNQLLDYENFYSINTLFQFKNI